MWIRNLDPEHVSEDSTEVFKLAGAMQPGGERSLAACAAAGGTKHNQSWWVTQARSTIPLTFITPGLCTHKTGKCMNNSIYSHILVSEIG